MIRKDVIITYLKVPYRIKKLGMKLKKINLNKHSPNINVNVNELNYKFVNIPVANVEENFNNDLAEIS